MRARGLRARGLHRRAATRARTSRVGAEVGTFWLVQTRSSATRRSATRSAALNGTVRVAEAGYGAGVYEAVVTTLAERR